VAAGAEVLIAFVAAPLTIEFIVIRLIALSAAVIVIAAAVVRA
jgi:hypothetical protein